MTLTAADIAQGIIRLAEAIRARTAGAPIALVGVRRRGDEVAERVLALLKQDSGQPIDFGILDISLYRDDFEHLHETPTLQGSDIPFPVDGAHIILVDDVLFTGRTIRAALDALADYGRPGRVELAVLIDRGHRELPIQPDYTGISLNTNRLDHVHVSLTRADGTDKVEVVSKTTP
ncbi:MAG: bifunctional pyr operon transcriptional regulator/uracil phosphoribosyltransferase PyrR [Akkermansiaceae bacterium]|jgi:pyrimidine operon attenuation protein/uracil phosphoribosyltransferase|nr:bifunctional pyr operon transcriptional regulator/uracil phosphoribosyltransferase PyrR [Akkermansiaceae bacterium]